MNYETIVYSKIVEHRILIDNLSKSKYNKIEAKVKGIVHLNGVLSLFTDKKELSEEVLSLIFE